jgi:hypothetical protein
VAAPDQQPYESKVKQSTPELLLERSERTLRLVLRAIIRGNPDELGRTEEQRVVMAAAILLGRKPPRGAPGIRRDDILEMMTFLYSLPPVRNKRKVSIEHAAKSVIDMPGGPGKDPEGSIVKDLVRKFTAHQKQLLAAHAYDGNESFEAIYGPVADALTALAEAGVNIDRDTIPMTTRKGHRGR